MKVFETTVTLSWCCPDDETRKSVGSAIEKAAMDMYAAVPPAGGVDVAMFIELFHELEWPPVEESERPGGEMTPGKLRSIAKWFDTYDQVYATAAQALGEKYEQPNTAKAVAAIGGDSIQLDLRRWADELEARDA